MKRALFPVVFLFSLAYLISVGGMWRASVAVFFYAVAGYVIWRAWPSVRRDLGRVRSSGLGLGRFSRSRGRYL